MKQGMRVGIYARVSTDDRGQDPLNQLLQLREFTHTQGWTIVGEYIDELSAKNVRAASCRDKDVHSLSTCRRAVSGSSLPALCRCLRCLPGRKVANGHRMKPTMLGRTATLILPVLPP